MENYKLDKKVFSNADLSALLMGLSSLLNRSVQSLSGIMRKNYLTIKEFW